MEKLRLQFDVTPEALELIDQLKDKSGVSTRAEFIRKAIRTYAILLQKESEGYEIHLIENDKDIQFPLSWAV